MKNHNQTLAFDVGGTLLTFDLAKLAQAYVDACAKHGIALNFDATRAMVQELELELPTRSRERQISLEAGYGQGFWVDFYAEGFRRLGVERDMTDAAVEITRHFQRAEFETLYSDVLPALDTLAALHVPLGILSNFSPNCEDVLRQMGIHRYFSFFVVSALAGVEKPDPRIFELMVHSANRPRSEIIYIGDSLFHDVEGAARAGIAAILVDRRDRYPNFEGMRVRNLGELTAYVEKEGNANSTRKGA